jgi:hypothetical protein
LTMAGEQSQDLRRRSEPNAPPAASRFAPDSALEGDGFEPSVPRRRPSPP